MLKKSVPLYLKYITVSVAGGAAALVLLISRGVFSCGQSAAEVYKNLSDAFAVPGAFMLIISALIFAGNEGAFTGLSFAFIKTLNMLVPFAGRNRDSYREYRARKEENKVGGYSFIFITGLVFLAVATLFFALYYLRG